MQQYLSLKSPIVTAQANKGCIEAISFIAAASFLQGDYAKT
jgi:hypothetical protein